MLRASAWELGSVKGMTSVCDWDRPMFESSSPVELVPPGMFRGKFPESLDGCVWLPASEVLLEGVLALVLWFFGVRPYLEPKIPISVQA